MMGKFANSRSNRALLLTIGTIAILLNVLLLLSAFKLI